MLRKNDCLMLLTELEALGYDVDVQMKKLMMSKDLSLDIIKFINDCRPLDVTNFYNHLRVNYNKKKSKLYINIVKEIDEPDEVLTTLASLNLQILLYSREVEDKQLFYSHTRADEITKVLNNYYNTYDISSCVKLLKLIKADLKALEEISR